MFCNGVATGEGDGLMTLLVAATLIGVFLTPSGIVVGADGAGGVSDGTFVVLRKVVICGPRSIATLSGTTAGSTELSGRRVMLDSHKIIAEACKSLQPSQSVRTQTAEIARALTLLLWCLRPKSLWRPTGRNLSWSM